MSTEAFSPDILVRNCGTVWQLFPLSQRASDWFDDHVESESWQWMGSSLAVDWRFAGPLVDGARAAGLSVKEWGQSCSGFGCVPRGK